MALPRLGSPFDTSGTCPPCGRRVTRDSRRKPRPAPRAGPPHRPHPRRRPQASAGEARGGGRARGAAGAATRSADGAAASEQRGGCGVRVRAPGTPPRSGPRCPRGPARAGRASTSRRARREPRRPDRRARGQTLKPRPPSRACETLLRISISLLRVISIFDFLFIFSQLVRHFDNRIKPHTTRSHLRREVRTGFHDETKRSLERREPHPASLSSVKCLAERFYTPLQ